MRLNLCAIVMVTLLLINNMYILLFRDDFYLVSYYIIINNYKLKLKIHICKMRDIPKYTYIDYSSDIFRSNTAKRIRVLINYNDIQTMNL